MGWRERAESEVMHILRRPDKCSEGEGVVREGNEEGYEASLPHDMHGG